jgi:macrophage erythroblast attacher
MRDRVGHLKEFETLDGPSNSSQYSNWADTRLDRWLVDWSLRNNKQKTARLLAQEKGIEVICSMLIQWLRMMELT